MKIIKIPFETIQFIKKEVNEDLKHSLLRISFAFPIKVRMVNDTYECIDGHKRLSAVLDIRKDSLLGAKFQFIPAILVDNTRTDNGWSRMRHH